MAKLTLIISDQTVPRVVVLGDPKSEVQDDITIFNPACLPVVGSTVDTPEGVRVVTELHFDYNPETGSCRVHAFVKRKTP